MPTYRCRHTERFALHPCHGTEQCPEKDPNTDKPRVDSNKRLLVLGGMINTRQGRLEPILGDIAGAVGGVATVSSLFMPASDKPPYIVVRLARLFPGGKVHTVARADLRLKTPKQLQQYLASLFGLSADQIRVSAIESAAEAYFSEDLTSETNVQLMVDAAERIDVCRNFGQ